MSNEHYKRRHIRGDYKSLSGTRRIIHRHYRLIKCLLGEVMLGFNRNITQLHLLPGTCEKVQMNLLDGNTLIRASFELFLSQCPKIVPLTFGNTLCLFSVKILTSEKFCSLYIFFLLILGEFGYADSLQHLQSFLDGKASTGKIICL